MQFKDVELPSNRKFGFFFAAVFAAAGFYFYDSADPSLAYGLLVVAALFSLAATLLPNVLLPLNKLWMRLGLLLGMIVSPLVLGLIFFLIFAPIGLIMRLFGRDELRLKVKDSESHWKPRSVPPVEDDAFKNQF